MFVDQTNDSAFDQNSFNIHCGLFNLIFVGAMALPPLFGPVLICSVVPPSRVAPFQVRCTTFMFCLCWSEFSHSVRHHTRPGRSAAVLPWIGARTVFLSRADLSLEIVAFVQR